MKPSPLQLKRYFVSDINVSSNKDFDLEKEVRLDFEDLIVTSASIKAKALKRLWEVSLRIQFQPGPQTNVPYYFMVELLSLFDVHKSVPDEKIETLVKTNCPAVLYSMAREILRSVMAQGPFPSLILPTGTFYEPKLRKKQPKQISKQKAKPQSKTLKGSGLPKEQGKVTGSHPK